MAKDLSLLGLIKDFGSNDSKSRTDDLKPAPDVPRLDVETPAPEFPGSSSDDFGLGISSPGKRKQAKDDGITENREANFSKEAGRFMDPDTGRFEPGSPPPDLDPSADRYRGKNGQFKKQSNDLFDEREEVRADSLEPEG